ncbi:MAG: hypothetical protein LWX70_16585 [Sphingobacteriia bacterium]|nr:hypothetical protein [Sphingobacteriia bacterium]
MKRQIYQGQCSICLAKNQDLTEDHVPPKGVYLRPTLKQTHRLKRFGSHDKKPGKRINGGLRFPTICRNCNNVLLGAKNDPELIKFCKNIHTHFFNSNGTGVLRIPFDGHKIARSVIGHIFAAHAINDESKETIINTGEADNLLRNYLLNEGIEFPSDWQLFCWPYYSKNNTQVILKSFTMADLSNVTGGDSWYCHLLKFYPVGLFLTYKMPFRAKMNNDLIGLFEITPTSDSNGNAYFEFNRIPHDLFPENPQGSLIILLYDKFTSSTSPQTPVTLK